jgi:hypothetical protein
MVVAAEANWNTNAWPAYAHPRMGATNILELYGAVSERWGAASETYVGTPAAPTVPTWFRFNKTLLENYKAKIKDLFTDFRPNNGWINIANLTNTTITASMLTPLKLSNMYVMARLPTNYLDYTPWRCLDGLGPFTNDVSVGHGYGWTNEYTAAGGTNFPAGRTNWYTTDYGYDGLKSMLTNLTAYWNPPDVYFADQSGFSEKAIKTSYPDTLKTTWNDAVADFSAQWNDGWTNVAAGVPLIRTSYTIKLNFYNYLPDPEEVHIHSRALGDYPAFYQSCFDPRNAMADAYITQSVDRVDLYGYWYNPALSAFYSSPANVFGFNPSNYKDSTNYVFWETLTFTGTNVVAYGSNIFETIDASLSDYDPLPDNNNGTLETQVDLQGALIWFDFVYK